MTDKKIVNMTKPELIATLEECEGKISALNYVQDEIAQIRIDLNNGVLLEQFRMAHTDSIAKHEEIEIFYKATFVDDAENKSMKTGLEETVAQIEETKKNAWKTRRRCFWVY